ncbi:MAG: class I SAM-dependent methyltransferase [Candidatus Edwardsbacteria bacterium]|jgi:predicted O-methyltransferase YrrM|nr:class I SAM-dependent methyltransferase [Candidatus Edwardsbacteria bacterium]
MNIGAFQKAFHREFPAKRRHVPTPWHRHWFWRRFFDPCPDVPGMISVKKQRLLNLAFSFLAAGECYLEVGTYQGKSLISAVKGNPPRPVHAVDNFTEFTAANTQQLLMANLARYGMGDKVKFHNADFRTAVNRALVAEPVGLYFYDGAHDEESQYAAIRVAEPLLADEALVIIDDWRNAPDSPSFAQAGTERAVAGSKNAWTLLYDLPARFNADRELWWNGVAVYGFKRARA